MDKKMRDKKDKGGLMEEGDLKSKPEEYRQIDWILG
jgi:hypothetical protein